MRATLHGVAYAWHLGPWRWLVFAAGGCLALTFALSAMVLPGVPCASFHCEAGHSTPVHIESHLSTAGFATWLLMVGAMMPPLLSLPVGHLCHSVFPRHRAPSLAIFTVGYLASWASAGLVLLPAFAVARSALGSLLAPSILLTALIWSATPLGQLFRNRCHRLIPIHPIGYSRHRSCFVQGIVTGVPCIGACWPWMLLPMAFGHAEVAVTAAVALILFLERAQPSIRPRWRSPQAAMFRLRSGRV